MTFFLRRSRHQTQFGSALRAQDREPPRLHDIANFALGDIDEHPSWGGTRDRLT
jgi:hypothetical protein